MYNISIIIVTYNEEKHISRAIRSCLDQSLPRNEYEIIVVNDGSTDKTKNILSTFQGFYAGLPFIKVITLGESMGIGYASNKGIEQALGQYVVRVDADDYVNNKMLEIGQLFLNMNKEFDAVACDYLIVNEYGETIERKSCETDPIACGIMFRKDKLIDAGLYDDSLRRGEDVDLRKRFMGNIYHIPLPLYRYRK